jgi:hypothetical protein
MEASKDVYLIIKEVSGPPLYIIYFPTIVKHSHNTSVSTFFLL